MADALIEATGLHKAFASQRGEGSVRAVDGVDLRVGVGEIYGLVGSDGAGKTTTLRLLVGALKMDAGRAALAGYDVEKHAERARAQVGYLSQRFSLYEDLTVLENIRFFAEVRGLKAREWRPRCLEILEFVGLADFKDRLAGQLSGGMKQKLGLASALVSRPRVLLLDEPTTGVDPVTRQDFWQLIIRLAAAGDGQGVCVLVSTPYMDEAARCHRVGFMRLGRFIAEGSPGQLRATLADRILELRGGPLPLLRRLAAQDPLVDDVHTFGDRLHVRLKEPQASAVIERLRAAVLADGAALAYSAAHAGRAVLQEARPIPPALEDVFMALARDED
jgi:ABC-2 type transport system ATP-binding protein